MTCCVSVRKSDRTVAIPCYHMIMIIVMIIIILFIKQCFWNTPIAVWRTNSNEQRESHGMETSRFIFFCTFSKSPFLKVKEQIKEASRWRPENLWRKKNRILVGSVFSVWVCNLHRVSPLKILVRKYIHQTCPGLVFTFYFCQTVLGVLGLKVQKWTVYNIIWDRHERRFTVSLRSV